MIEPDEPPPLPSLAERTLRSRGIGWYVYSAVLLVIIVICGRSLLPVLPGRRPSKPLSLRNQPPGTAPAPVVRKPVAAKTPSQKPAKVRTPRASAKTAPTKTATVVAADGDAYPVVRAASGKTVYVRYRGEEVAVRLLNVDPPDRGEEGYDEAKAFVERMVEGKRVRLVFENDNRKADHYRRLLAHILVGDKNVSLELVRAGLSRYATDWGEGVFPEEFKRAEAEARKGRRGLWRKAAQ